MRNDVRISGNVVSAIGDACDRFFDSVFFTGNGRMGVRGCPAFRPEPRPLDAGLFIAGIFDKLSPGGNITDFVALPSPVWCSIERQGERCAISSDVERRLDLASGELTISYTVTAGGNSARVTESRLFPIGEPGQVYQRFTLSADTPFTLTLGIDEEIYNCPIPDDQVKENSEVVQLFVSRGIDAGENGIHAAFATRFTGLDINYDLRFSSSVSPSLSGARVSFTCREISVDTVCDIRTNRDADPRIGAGVVDISYDAALERARSQTAARTADCAVRIEGDNESEGALGWVIYELLANIPARDGTVGVGARGLTHTRYKGCCFWDTEMFVLPFSLLTDPAAARKMLDFRVGTLPAAREHAQKMNATGARYPWMVSFDGSEQCESWDIGCSELHVTADVAYAAGQYLDWTGDADFLDHGGAEMLIDTARFWPSRYSPAPDGGVNLLFCKGPDEYCGITSNNLYTNVMVKHNIALALEAAARLDPVQRGRLGVTDAELKALNEFAGKIKLPRDSSTGHWRQDDTFELLEKVDIKSLKSDDRPLYSRVCFDALQRLKVIKQADVLLLMSRFPERFTHEEKLAAWEDFEPLCLHDSTLSFATHALFAAQNGLLEAAMRYFGKALWLDLRDVMSNTGKEGLHLACLGETYQAVVFGFAGLHLENDKPALAPNLPEQWRSVEFPFHYRGRKYKARATHDGGAVEAVD